MKKNYISFDNGVTALIAFLSEGKHTRLFHIPVFNELSYTKEKQYITRINTKELKKLIRENCDLTLPTKVIIERPMVNPKRFKSTQSALRALEATLIVLEDLDLSYEYKDSKEWQKEMLPNGLKGSELKKASRNIGIRLFPEFRELITDHGDADGLLLGEWARRKGL